MLKDRGTIKWTSLMLPEHVALLKEMWQEDTHLEKPIVDEQELLLINERILASFHQNESICINVYEAKNIQAYKGTVVQMDHSNQTITLLLTNDVKKVIHAPTIISTDS